MSKDGKLGGGRDMKITDIKLIVLEDPERFRGFFKLKEVPNLRRIQYTHGSVFAAGRKALCVRLSSK